MPYICTNSCTIKRKIEKSCDMIFDVTKRYRKKNTIYYIIKK